MGSWPRLGGWGGGWGGDGEGLQPQQGVPLFILLHPETPSPVFQFAHHVGVVTLSVTTSPFSPPKPEGLNLLIVNATFKQKKSAETRLSHIGFLPVYGFIFSYPRCSTLKRPFSEAVLFNF